MKKITACILIFLIISCKEKNGYDTIIRNGMIYDGSGDEPFKADIGIRADTIAFIGDLSGIPAKNEVEAKDMGVSPGFIDTHSHHAGVLFEQRDMPAAVSQGITTIITGQDGSSEFPLANFYRQLADSPVAVNIASYSGHNKLRSLAMGEDFKRHCSKPEIDTMKKMLQQDLQAGALGLSTGLEYDPGIYSDKEEVVALARELSAFNGRYISHIRSEDRYFWDAVNEIINIGKEAKIPVQISHFKLAMHGLWGKADSVISLLEKARSNGINITADLYPYAFWQSTIRVFFPGRNFTDEKEAAYILREITLPEDIIISEFELHREYEGKSLADIAKLENRSPARMLVELIARIEEWEKINKRGCNESVIATSMSEPDIKKLMTWEHTNICSDGRSNGGHPRGFGAFTRVLGRYVRQEKTLNWQQAINKMTWLAAEHVGIKKRGLLKQGYYADIVLFDPATVKDEATITEPHKISTGIEKVWVNGSIVFENGKTTGRYTGKIIRR